MARTMQRVRRRRPRVNQDRRDRRTRAGCCSGTFFRGERVFLGVPHSGGDRPIDGDGDGEQKAVDALGQPELAVLDVEAAGFEVGEQSFDPPAHLVVAGPPCV